jgi:hypothetical protein
LCLACTRERQRAAADHRKEMPPIHVPVPAEYGGMVAAAMVLQ